MNYGIISPVVGVYMKVKSNNIAYLDESHKGEEIKFSLNKLEIKSKFYEILDDPFFIIKQYEVSDEEALFKMLLRFKEVHEHIEKTDLPISYYKENNITSGQIIPYYEDSANLYNLSMTKNLDRLMEVYKKDDDKVHNLFLLYQDIVDIIEELWDYDILYQDSNSTNFVFKDNKVHLIDFDPKYVILKNKKKSFIQTLCGLDDLADRMNGRFLGYDEFIYMPNSFKGLRKHLVKVENRVRKREQR